MAALLGRVEQVTADCPVCGAPDALLVTYLPAHHDRPGRTLVMCKTGCRPAAILAALGLTERDTYDDPGHAEIPTTRRMAVGRPFLQPGECPACNPDWIDATLYRLFAKRPRS